jgi:hypothetical protein
LPGNDKGKRHTNIQTDRGFMNYAVEIGSAEMLYVSSFRNIVSGIKKLAGRDTHTDTEKSSKFVS